MLSLCGVVPDTLNTSFTSKQSLDGTTEEMFKSPQHSLPSPIPLPFPIQGVAFEGTVRAWRQMEVGTFASLLLEVVVSVAILDGSALGFIAQWMYLLGSSTVL